MRQQKQSCQQKKQNQSNNLTDNTTSNDTNNTNRTANIIQTPQNPSTILSASPPPSIENTFLA